MAMTGAMGAGIAGMKAYMEALNVVGNNVANVNTYGYKPGRVTFKESIYSTQTAGSDGTDVVGGTNPTQIGYGTSVGTIDLKMDTQNVESTGLATDCAIAGDGFFLLGDKQGVSVDNLDSLKLSRVGNFGIDSNGYLTDGEGNIVYGFVTCNMDGDKQDGDPGTNGDGVSTQLVPIRLPLAAKDGQKDIEAGAAIYPGVDGDGKNVYDDDNLSTGKCIEVQNLTIDKTGKITATNKATGDPLVIGYIALGSVTNPNGLTHIDGPYYQAAGGAGDLTVSTPTSAVTGYLDNQEAADNPDPLTMLAAGSGTKLMSGFLEIDVYKRQSHNRLRHS